MRIEIADMRIFIIALFLLFFACNSNNKTKMGSGYSVSSFSESEERVEKILPAHGKEDVSRILKLDIADSVNKNQLENPGYFANDQFDWILTIEAQNGESIHRDSVLKYFDREWSEEHRFPWMYCIPSDDQKWTFFASSENETKSLSKVAFAWKLFESLEEPPVKYDEPTLKAFKESVIENADKINSIILSENYNTSEAAEKSMELLEFVSKNNQYSVIILKTEDKFDGKEIWDVMMSLGLKWGDMDLFHWNNEFQYGDDQLMSVWTSSDPGYFMPEDIAAGRVHTKDLIFGFSIPRSIAPKEVLHVMYDAVEYAKSRLGGQLYDENSEPFELEKESEKINAITQSMAIQGIKPGMDDALYLFQ